MDYKGAYEKHNSEKQHIKDYASIANGRNINSKSILEERSCINSEFKDNTNTTDTNISNIIRRNGNRKEKYYRLRNSLSTKGFLYWSQVVRKSFVPIKDERKEIELNIMNMRRSKKLKKKFNFIKLKDLVEYF